MLTPQDISEKEFKKSLMGYNAEEVEIFLREISDSYEKLYKENLVAKERISMLSDAVKQYKSMEETMQSALSVAESNGEEAKKNARDKAGLIISNAESQAAEIVSRAEKEAAEIVYGYEQMRRSVEVFKAKVVSLLNAQLDIIKDYSSIEVDDKTLQNAKTIYEKNLSRTSKKIDEQDTEEIPQISDDKI